MVRKPVNTLGRNAGGDLCNGFAFRGIATRRADGFADRLTIVWVYDKADLDWATDTCNKHDATKRKKSY